jgi:hypothetical protein
VGGGSAWRAGEVSGCSACRGKERAAGARARAGAEGPGTGTAQLVLDHLLTVLLPLLATLAAARGPTALALRSVYEYYYSYMAVRATGQEPAGSPANPCWLRPFGVIVCWGTQAHWLPPLLFAPASGIAGPAVYMQTAVSSQSSWDFGTAGPGSPPPHLTSDVASCTSAAAAACAGCHIVDPAYLISTSCYLLPTPAIWQLMKNAGEVSGSCHMHAC